MLLFVADYVRASDLYSSPAQRLRWTLDRGDHLHFAVHLLGGRLLDVCPCTRELALDQYDRATYHADTERQISAVTDIRPDSPGGWVRYAVAPLMIGAEWARNGLEWLSGQRAPDYAEVRVRSAVCLPSVVHVSAGAQVVWRNVDTQTVFVDFPKSHLVGQRLDPQATLTAFFAQPGRMEFTCGPYPPPEDEAAAPGVVVVD